MNPLFAWLVMPNVHVAERGHPLRCHPYDRRDFRLVAEGLSTRAPSKNCLALRGALRDRTKAPTCLGRVVDSQGSRSPTCMGGLPLCTTSLVAAVLHSVVFCSSACATQSPRAYEGEEAGPTRRLGSCLRLLLRRCRATPRLSMPRAAAPGSRATRMVTVTLAAPMDLIAIPFHQGREPMIIASWRFPRRSVSPRLLF